MMTEEWRVTDSYPSYAVSSLGRVKRVTETRKSKTARILKPVMRSEGNYLVVTLMKGEARFNVSVHVLVARAFFGERPVGMEINHKDGNKLNNVAANLEYVTKSENALHAFRLGLRRSVCGERQGQSKLTEEQVLEIRKLYNSTSNRRLAKIYSVSETTIRHIGDGKAWKHLLVAKL